MSYMESLTSVLPHDGPDHQLVTPASKAAETSPSAGYQMPAVAVHQPGTAAVNASSNPGMLQTGAQGMQQAGQPYVAPQVDYQPVQFQQPQLGVYQGGQPSMANLAFLLQGQGK